MSFQTPVLLLVYNRPELTRRMLRSLEEVKPRHLYVVADGPKDYERDTERCQQTRKFFDNLPWDCTVNTLFRKGNLGCARSVSDGITWFFDQVSEGIIIEDDCIADPSFFHFCESLLEKYRHRDAVFHIGGNNFQDGKIRGTGDYYFSIFNHIWGWATWRRAWQKFEFAIDPEETESFRSFIKDGRIRKYFKTQFNNASTGQIDTWAYRWTFACWKNKGLSIVPSRNLVSNIGFGVDSTHTKQEDSPMDNMSRYSVKFPLQHPKKIKAHRIADIYTFKKVFQPKRSMRYYAGTFKNRIKGILKSMVYMIMEGNC